MYANLLISHVDVHNMLVYIGLIGALSLLVRTVLDSKPIPKPIRGIKSTVLELYYSTPIQKTWNIWNIWNKPAKKPCPV